MRDFGFTGWPFAVVPNRSRAAQLWADRRRTRQQIEDLLETWQLDGGSSIHLLWADLGAGKTHSLWYLEHRCTAEDGLLPIYVLLPSVIGDFRLLYQQIADALDWNLVAARAVAPKSNVERSAHTALRWVGGTVDPRRSAIAGQWLTGKKTSAGECQAIGVGGPLVTADDAIKVLSYALACLTSTGERVVLMIDEYQRVAEGRRQQLRDIGHGVHAFFNACPNDLALILSCATGGIDDYTLVLTPELVSRLSPSRIELPYMCKEDILTYVCDLFEHYRSGKTLPAFYPLTEEGTKLIGEFLLRITNNQVGPRLVNKAFGWLLAGLGRGHVEPPYGAEAIRQWLDAHADASELLRE